MNTLTSEQFEEQYGDMMLDGLSSVGTYIPLRTNKKLGINVAIRPYVTRISDGVVLFGGKLRVGYTFKSGTGDYIKAKVTALNEETRVQQLKDFCKGWTWQNVSEGRFSTVVGIGVAGSKYDGDLVLDAITDSGLAGDFLKRLETTYSKYNDASFQAIRKASSALHDAWVLQMQSGVFAPLPVATQLPEAIVGQKTGVLNKAQDKYQDNVVDFQEKVNAMKAANAELEEVLDITSE